MNSKFNVFLHDNIIIKPLASRGGEVMEQRLIGWEMAKILLSIPAKEEDITVSVYIHLNIIKYECVHPCMPGWVFYTQMYFAKLCVLGTLLQARSAEVLSIRFSWLDL